MHCSQSPRLFVLACWSFLALQGAWGCGSARTGDMAGLRTEALNAHRFSLDVEWLSGEPVATQKASARLSFQNAQGEPAQVVVIKSIQLIMTCCRDQAPTPQVESEAGMNPAQRDVGGILPTKSGNWELVVTAEVDGAAADTVTWTFNASKP